MPHHSKTPLSVQCTVQANRFGFVPASRMQLCPAPGQTCKSRASAGSKWGGSRGACFSSNWREKRRECSSSDLSFGSLSPAPALLVSFVAAMAKRLRANSQALSVFRVATLGHRAELNQPAGEVSHASPYFGRQGDRNNIDDGCSCNIKLSF